jgi:hypothetical protein
MCRDSEEYYYYKSYEDLGDNSNLHINSINKVLLY